MRWYTEQIKNVALINIEIENSSYVHRPIYTLHSLARWLLSCNSAFSFIFLHFFSHFESCAILPRGNKLKIYSLLIHFSSPLPSAAHKFFSLSSFYALLLPRRSIYGNLRQCEWEKYLRERRKFLKVNAMCLIIKDRFLLWCAFFLIPAYAKKIFLAEDIFWERSQCSEPENPYFLTWSFSHDFNATKSNPLNR